MAQKQFILTYEGLKKLEEELDYLKTVKRREIAERSLKIAGDICIYTNISIINIFYMEIYFIYIF